MTQVTDVLEAMQRDLLARLWKVPGLLFVGEPEYIDYLAEFFKPPSRHAYVAIDERARDWQKLLTGRSTIVAVGGDEEAIAAGVAHELAQFGRPLPVTRLFADLFVNAMSGGDLWQANSSGRKPPKVAYAILCTPRCGSQFLCEALTGTQIAGHPREHLRRQSTLLAEYCHFDINRYLQIAMSRDVTPNAVFGTKLISHFLRDHMRLSPELESTLARFRFIRIVRRDAVGQAISAMLASRTKVYHVRNEAEEKSLADRLISLDIRPEDLQYVEQLRKGFAAQNGSIDEFLCRHGIDPLVLTYEELTDKTLESVNKVLSFLNISGNVDSVNASVRKAESSVAEAVRVMYRAAFTDA